MNRLILAASAGALLATACASYPKPTDRLISSQASLRGAEEAGAPAHPQASLHMKLAQEEVNKAKALIDDGENERADYMLMRAKADADIALALARTNKSLAVQQQVQEKAANSP